MAFIVELDEECRFQFPDALRESLHLAPGAQLQVERDGDTDRIVVSPSYDDTEPHLEWEDGLPVIVGGPVPTMDVVDQIRWMRAERSAQIMGPPYTAADFLDPADEL